MFGITVSTIMVNCMVGLAIAVVSTNVPLNK